MKKSVFAAFALLLTCAAFAQGPARDVPSTAPQPTNVDKPDFKYYSGMDKGFWAGVDLGSGVSFTNAQVGVPLDFTVILGYRFNQFIKIGAGGGMRYNFISSQVRQIPASSADNTQGNWSFPIYFEARGNFFKQEYREVVPFWRADVGYTIFDGFMFSPGLGLSFGNQERNHFVLAISYIGQMSKYAVYRTGDTFTVGQGYINQFQLKLGYEF